MHTGHKSFPFVPVQDKEVTFLIKLLFMCLLSMYVLLLQQTFNKTQHTPAHPARLHFTSDDSEKKQLQGEVVSVPDFIFRSSQ